MTAIREKKSGFTGVIELQRRMAAYKNNYSPEKGKQLIREIASQKRLKASMNDGSQRRMTAPRSDGTV
jgi:hypothetical protein